MDPTSSFLIDFLLSESLPNYFFLSEENNIFSDSPAYFIFHYFSSNREIKVGKQTSVGGSWGANRRIDLRVVSVLQEAGDAQVKSQPSSCVCHSGSVHTTGQMSTVALDQGFSRSALLTFWGHPVHCGTLAASLTSIH